MNELRQILEEDVTGNSSVTIGQGTESQKQKSGSTPKVSYSFNSVAI